MKRGWLVILLLIFLFPAVHAESADFTLTESGNIVTLDYTLSGTAFCFYLDVYQNDVRVAEKDLSSEPECNKQGTFTLPNNPPNAFYLKVSAEGVSDGYFLSAVKTLEEDTTPATASGLKFLRNNAEVTRVSLGNPFLVDVVFTLDALASGTADLSGMTEPQFQDEYKSIPLNSCVLTNGTYTCTIKNKYLVPFNDTVSILINITDENGNNALQTLSKTFTVSEGNPEISSIRTDSCIENQCYVKNGVNKIMLDIIGTNAGFASKQVFFSFGGNTISASQCSNTQCVGYATITCSDGPLSLYLTYSGSTPSQDDAGNLLTIPDDVNTALLCDNTNPVIITVAANSTGGNYTISGDTLTVKAMVQEANTPKAFMNFTAFGGSLEEATCAQKNNQWECTASVGVMPGPYTGKVSIIVLDAVNNTATSEISHQVYGANASIADNWNIATVKNSPQTLNLQFAKYSNQKVIYALALQEKISNLQIVRMEKGLCIPANEQTNANDVAWTGFMNPGKNPIAVFTLAKRQDLSEGDLLFNCTLKITTKRGNFIYTTPEQETFQVKVHLIPGDSMGSKVQEELNKTRQRTEAQVEFFNSLQRFVAYSKPVCDIIVGVRNANGALGAGQTATAPLGDVPIANAIPTALGSGAKLTGTVGDKLADIPGIMDVCGAITCSGKANRLITDQLGNLPGVNEMSKIAGASNYSDLVNPYESLIMSYATLCVPAIIYNHQKMQTIDCRYMQCLSADVAAGLPISQCQREKSFADCKYIYGEVFQVIPYTAIQRAVGQTAKQVLSNPISAFGTAGMYLICSKIHFGESLGHTAHGICNTAMAVDSVRNFYSYVQGIANTQYFSPTAGANYCDSVLNNIDSKTGYWGPTIQGPDYSGSLYTQYPEMGPPSYRCSVANGCTYANNEHVSVVYTPGETESSEDARKNLENYHLYIDQVYQGNFETVNSQLYDTAQVKDKTPISENNLPNLPEDYQLTVDTDYATGGSFEGLTAEQVTEQLKNPYTHWTPDQLARLQSSASSAARITSQYQEDLHNKIKSQVSENVWNTMEEVEQTRRTYQNQENAILDLKDEKSELQNQQTDLDSQIADLEETKDNIRLGEYPEITPEKVDDEIKKIDDKLSDKRKELQTATTKLNEKEEEIKTAEKDKNKAKDKYEDSKKDLETEMKYEQYFGTGWAAYSSALRFGRSTAFFSNMLFKDSFAGWRSLHRQLFESDVGETITGSYEDLICEQKFEKSGSSQGYAIVSSGRFGFRSAAHVEGERTQKINVGEGEQYYYYITGSVFSAKKDGLQFTIVLQPGNKVLTEKTLNQSQSYSFTKSEMLKYSSTTLYNQVCIQFENGNLLDYFDEVNTEDNRICNTLSVQQ
ncbi:hypothetical protein C4573_02865 [Candidatus Woesearchaeota archaeon]|nr:MAG: hypothetical protein C4573_02865 [Candidatus Woesearchaeota archaeon]